MIGLSVQRCQDTVSQDVWTVPRHIRRMVQSELQFNTRFRERVKRLREERGWTAEEMAMALDIPAERYRKYESRSPMPHYLLVRFALIVGRDVEYILTGKLPPRRPKPESRRKLA